MIDMVRDPVSEALTLSDGYSALLNVVFYRSINHFFLHQLKRNAEDINWVLGYE